LGIPQKRVKLMPRGPASMLEAVALVPANWQSLAEATSVLVSHPAPL